MGSIADLLGDQLRAGLAQLVDPDADGDAPEAADVSLYAVVARVEREAKVGFSDAQIEGWQTLGDLLDAAATAASQS